MSQMILGGPNATVDPVTGQTKGAVKYDGGKLPVTVGCIEYFPVALMAVSGISLFGYEKYKEWGGWRKVVDGLQRYMNAVGRHFVTKDQPDITPDTQSMQEILGPLVNGKASTRLVHMSQLAWNSLATLELQIEQERYANSPAQNLSNR